MIEEMYGLFDAGSLAEWVSAIGSLGAIGAALILANIERRHARRMETAAVQRKAEGRQRALSAAARLGNLVLDRTAEDDQSAVGGNTWNEVTAFALDSLKAIQEGYRADPDISVALQELIWAMGPARLFKWVNGDSYNRTLGERRADVRAATEKLAALT
jgi:hypothetical protein